MRRFIALLVALTSAFVVLVLAPGAAANDTQCSGTLAGGTHDNVVVLPGQTCILTGATVRGNVKALQDARLRVSGSSVGGNVEGDKADVVQVNGSTVRENIVIKEAGPPVATLPGFITCAFGFEFTPCEALVFGVTVERGSVQIERVHGSAFILNSGLLNPIRGNIKVEDNLASPMNELMSVQNNRVEQNVQVFKNKGPGNKEVVLNTVGGSLQCFENDPPFFTGGNFARQVQGQCTAAPLPMSLAFSVSALVGG